MFTTSTTQHKCCHQLLFLNNQKGQREQIIFSWTHFPHLYYKFCPKISHLLTILLPVPNRNHQITNKSLIYAVHGT